MGSRFSRHCLILALLVGCSDSSTNERADVDIDPPRVRTGTEGGPFMVRGRVEPAGSDARLHHRVRIQRIDGVEEPPVLLPVYGDGGFRSKQLKSGEVLVSCRLPIALQGPWYHWHQVIDGTGGGVHELLVRPPDAAARMVIEVEPDTPPFLMLLTSPDAQVPPRLNRLMAWLKDDIGPKEISFSLQSDGQSKLRLPPLPVGRYKAWVVANKASGSLAPEVRGVELELKSEGTVTLSLTNRLVTLSVR
ncbi:MAG: hypothetical protein HRU14_05460 [Planctomycetes bacterium]|nr:hypothetical protein [Planctomycetota bacterium]